MNPACKQEFSWIVIFWFFAFCTSNHRVNSQQEMRLVLMSHKVTMEPIRLDDVENGAVFLSTDTPELKHGSHKCVLTAPETIADGICNICFKDEPVEFACNPCNFDLCKPCSNIPQKVSHDFHPEHSLEFCVHEDDGKPTNMLCSGCGNLFTERFYYKCTVCKIYLELGCGIVKNIATGWAAEERLHYSHAHMIRRCKPGLKVKGSCSLCELPLSPSAICYGCVLCYSFVHERCLDLPREIQHPVHPAHPLIRLDFTNTCGKGRDCDACGLHIDGAPFGCPECNLILHTRCADSLLRGLMHQSHEHKLFYSATGAKHAFDRHPCQICMTTDVISLDSFYHCLECDMKFHFECLGISESVFRKPYHIHPLVCKVFLLDDDSLEYCGVCETVVYTGHHAYSCQECDFVGHIECILREKAPSPLYLKDLYSWGNNMKTSTNRIVDCEAKEVLENKIVIAGIVHTHVMTMSKSRDFSVYCNICELEILVIPMECKGCNFKAHDYCLKWLKESRHRFHLNHPLTCLPSYPAMFPMSCDSCTETIKYFNLFCRICNITICSKCVVRANKFLREFHRGQKYIGTAEENCFEKSHNLAEVMVSWTYLVACNICDGRLCGKVWSCSTCEDIYHPRCIKLGRQERVNHPLHPDHKLQMIKTSGSKCVACKLSIKRYGYNCPTCSVSFHFGCIEAALNISSAGKIESHKHYLYNLWMDDDSRFKRACSVCGEPCRGSFYGCIDCNSKFRAHVECIGFPENVKNQQHQHFVKQSLSWNWMKRCSLCGLDIQSSDKIHYSCNQCEDVFHLKCIMSMDEREARTEEEQIIDIYLVYIEQDLFSLLKDQPSLELTGFYCSGFTIGEPWLEHTSSVESSDENSDESSDESDDESSYESSDREDSDTS